ncbi:rad25/xp-B DNA repair helicase, putative [Theileria equi strain WA]|uniref:DNA 3'-5' helicase n=1 Tax=Theileria equi strain WA TaxID=1537102 RepID=L0ATQ5_THEEQ|nr:rad25/xp-B DNA repair helicase, putative [Theileria equi strain WA]AFZ79027.1 rad25/xp-B DNA repair helicase, putative [Theileria equi strain WA]|eukprot:XP_004828693.1 rad25/xp-B DNA repair helicase, putative [Theileria equi strain WA]
MSKDKELECCNWGGLPFTVDGTEARFRRYRDYSKLVIKESHQNRPVWVCPDGYLYLELFTPVSKQALDFLVTIAEPVCRPELIHEYQVTVFSLYTAISVGLSFDELLSNLNKFSKNIVPEELKESILSTASSFGKIKLVLKDSKYWIESFERKELDLLLTNPEIRSARIHSNPWEVSNKTIDGSGITNSDYLKSTLPTADFSSFGFNSNEISDNVIEENIAVIGSTNFENKGKKNDRNEVFSFEVQQEKIEDIKREALQTMRKPLVMEYDFRKDNNTPSLNCCIRSNIKIRYYQERALRRMFSNGRARSGIIVLPCGAGKTLTGIVAACTVRKSIFVLTTSAVAVEQWIKQFLDFTNISATHLLSLTSENKADLWNIDESGVLVSTYTMMSYTRKHRENTERILNQIKEREWGLLIFDEVQFVPAPAFRRINEIIRSHCKLGLTATLVREDDLIKDLQWLIGPKLYEANWLELQEKGFLAKVICQEIWCPMTAAFYREYLRSDSAKKRRLWSCNPIKLLTCEYLLKYHEAKGDKVIVFSDNLFALLHVARTLNRPFIYGKVSSAERIIILNKFKNETTFNSIFLSKVGDNALDIPCANVVIQISFNFASRRQEAQRLGRILRPKSKTDEHGFNAFFYSLVSKDTQEMIFADKRQQFIIDQGYAYNVSSSTNVVKDTRNLVYANPKMQQDLLQEIIASSDDVDNDEEINQSDPIITTQDDDDKKAAQLVLQKRTALSSLSGSLKKQIVRKQMPGPAETPRKKQKNQPEQHPFFKKFFSSK